MIFQKYAKDTVVYNFYFDYESAKLLYKKMMVTNYDYMDGCQFFIIDEYTLIEEYFVKKYFFLTKKMYYIHRIPGHMISDNIEYAKIKFLYHFLKTFNFKQPENVSKPLYRLHTIACEIYNEILENFPETVLRATEDKITTNENYHTYWRY